MTPLARSASPLLLALAALFALAGPANADGTVGNSLPPGFPKILDASLGKALIGFGAPP